jgi:hypothetical protein
MDLSGGWLIASIEKTGTGNIRGDVDCVVPPDSPSCEIGGADGAGGGSVESTSRSSAAFGSL